MKIKWCVVGAAGIADRRTIPALLKNEENELVAVMDRVEEAAKKIGEKYNVPYFTDEAEMLKTVECDAVYIGTPVFCHKEQALTALKYGKNVFIEKPLAISEADSAEILDAFKAAGKQLTVGYMMKYHNLHEKAKSFVKNDKIGTVVNVRMQFSCWYPDITGAWRQNKKLGGGGAVMDLGVHCMELVEYVLDDKIEKIKAFYSTRTFKYEVEDGAVMIFETKKGVLGEIAVNFNIPDDASVSKFELYGTKGYINCKGTLGQEENGVMEYLYAPQGDYAAMQERKVLKPKKFKATGKDIYLKQLNEFCKVIAKGKPDYKWAKKAVHIQSLVDRIYKENI